MAIAGPRPMGIGEGDATNEFTGWAKGFVGGGGGAVDGGPIGSKDEELPIPIPIPAPKGGPRAGPPRCGKPVRDANGSSLFMTPAVASGIGRPGFIAPLIGPIAAIPPKPMPALICEPDDEEGAVLSIVRDGFCVCCVVAAGAFKSRFTRLFGAQGSLDCC